MSIGQEKPVSGRQMFLEQRARLQSSILVSRTNDTASRFNRLGETQKKVIIWQTKPRSGLRICRP